MRVKELKYCRNSIRRFWVLTKAGIMENLSYRMSHLVTVIANIVYLVIVYFLWKSIFLSSGTDIINGMSFNDTMIYLVLASALYNVMEIFLVWMIGTEIQTGTIILNMLKPMSYHKYNFFKYSGSYVLTFFVTFLPTFIFIYFFTQGYINIGVNIVLFIVSLIMSIIINFNVDMFVSTIGLYTQSIWGINIMKETIVLLFSGAIVPIAFFPDYFQKIVYFLPFQAIYNVPLTILTDKNLDMYGYCNMVGGQLIWIIIVSVISKLFWKISERIITINGG